jgi:hypothetical protein
MESGIEVPFPIRLSKGQMRRLKRYGKIPPVLRAYYRQLSSKPWDKPRAGSKGQNPIDSLWDGASFEELNQ